MRPLITLAGAAAMASVLAGCISHVSMTKVEPGTNPRGLRVHLPAPFIVGTPKADGQVEYKVELLPDPDKEYAIDAWTLMAKQKIALTRTIEMYLQKAEITQDTTAVAKALAEAAGEVSKSAISTLAQQRKDQATADAAATKARSDALATKETDLKAKTIALAKANAKLDAAKAEMTRDGSPENTKALAAAELEKNLAQIEYDAALDERDRLKGAAADDPSLTKGKSATPRGGGHPQMPGVVIYRIVEDPSTGGIRLEQVTWRLFSFSHAKVVQQSGQLRFETQGKKKAESGTTATPTPTPAASPASRPKVTKERIEFESSPMRPVTVMIPLSDSPERVNEKESMVTRLAPERALFKGVSYNLRNDGVLEMQWPANTPRGRYTAAIMLGFKGFDPYLVPVKFTVK